MHCVNEPRTKEDRSAPVVNPPPLSDLASSDTLFLVLSEGDSPGAIRAARGHIFERFFASFLHAYGYNKPTVEKRNVTAAGIELDITAVHKLTEQPAIVECKAQADPVNPTQLGKFHSRLVVERYKSPKTHGFFVAIPRFTAPAKEQADLIVKNDPAFSVLTANGLADQLRQAGAVVGCPLQGIRISDDAIIITARSIYAACLENDEATRAASRVLVWSASAETVPSIVLNALMADPYSQGVPVVDARSVVKTRSNATLKYEPGSLIVTVTGSDSDFEYQPPASPKHFVGRAMLVEQLGEFLDKRTAVLVLNAKSGWGKSSLALKLEQLVRDREGCALVVDSRTASNRRFVVDALSRVAGDASGQGVISLPSDASWASLASALQTVRAARWNRVAPVVLFFDQFENVFRDEALTKEFRDLALGVRELSGRLQIGFAWKTDDVGWIEDFPFHLRNEIRAGGFVPQIEPLSAPDITALLQRLQREMGHPLTAALSQMLREFSQGIPSMFKKLAAHILREVEAGATQERLASEGWNLRRLFEADLASLSSKEVAALKDIAQHAPIPVSEVAESIGNSVIRSLIHSRLVIEVGAQLDIYWDIFRDYLKTDRVPVQDSYIIRQTPLSVARLLREVVRDGGDSNTRDIARRLGTRENAVFNLSRELRLLGATTYEPNRVRLLDDIWNSSDREAELRRRVSVALRRHRAFATFLNMIERQGLVTVDAFALGLPRAFPAVEIKATTWRTYARSFLLWFEYAGLAIRSGHAWIKCPDGVGGKGQLLGAKLARRMRTGFLHEKPGPVLGVMRAMVCNPEEIPPSRLRTRSIRALILLGALDQESNGLITVKRPDLIDNDIVVEDVLRELMVSVPGVAAGLTLLATKPGAAPEELGEAIRRSLGAAWQQATKIAIGKNLRAWARYAGIAVDKVPRVRKAAS